VSSEIEGGREVYKYPLQWLIGAVQKLPIPSEADVLTAQIQGGALVIWASTPVNYKATGRAFKILGTGNGEVYSNDRYISTVQEGAFVWHVFEVIE